LIKFFAVMLAECLGVDAHDIGDDFLLRADGCVQLHKLALRVGWVVRAIWWD
jgi:hypothetical protein